MNNLSTFEIKLLTLKEIKRLTIEGILNWTCVETDTRFISKYNEKQFEVEFIRLLRTDEVGSDKIIASINIIDITEDFSIGTEGFDLIIETIAISQPKWKLSWEKGLEKLRNNLISLKEIKAD